MKTFQTIFALVILALAAPAANAQREVKPEDRPSPIGVVVGIKGGLVLTAPRREFPSLRIGESPGMGKISSAFGETGAGYRYGVAFLFPFSTTLGLFAEAGIQNAVVKIAGDENRLPIRFDVQTFNVAGGFEGNIFIDTLAFRRNGLRTVYASAGVDVAAENISNRIEGFTTDSTGRQQPAVGSFENDSPFRTLVGLRFAGGVRMGLDEHLEFHAEGSYAFAVNAMFSSDVVRDNGFTIDNMGIMIGLGYRW